MADWIKNVKSKVETAIFAVVSYFLIDKGWSIIGFLSIEMTNNKYKPIIDFILFQLLLNLLWEGIKAGLNSFYAKRTIKVDIHVKDNSTNAEVTHFNSVQKNREIKINLKVQGKRKKRGGEYLSLGTVKVVFPYWLGANNKLKGTVHDGAFKLYEQNVKRGIKNMYILVDLNALCITSEEDGIVDEDKELYLSVNCEDDEIMSSKKKLIINWDKENFVHKLYKNDFEFQYIK